MINIYSKPQEISLVDKLYVPPVDMLGKALEVKQKMYDTNMAEMMALSGVGAKVKAIGDHPMIVQGIVDNYQNKVFDAVLKAKGDFSVITPQLMYVKQGLMKEMSPNGTLGQINAYAEGYDAWKKMYGNDKNDAELYNIFSNKIYKDTRKDAIEWAKTGQFKYDNTRFAHIPGDSDAALKSVVDLADKYQVSKFKTYKVPYVDPVTQKIIIEETDNEYRGEKTGYDKVIEFLMQQNTTLRSNASLWESIAPGEGKKRLANWSAGALAILSRDNESTSLKYEAIDHHKEDNAMSAPIYFGTAKGKEVESQALGTSGWWTNTFSSKTFNNNDEVNNEIKSALTKSVGPGFWNTPSGMNLDNELKSHAAKGKNMSPSEYSSYLQKLYIDEARNYNRFSSYTDKHIMGQFPENKTREQLKDEVIAMGEGQMVTDKNGRRFKLGDSPNWEDITTGGEYRIGLLGGKGELDLYEKLKKGEAQIAIVPIEAGLGKGRSGRAIIYNGEPYFLDTGQTQSTYGTERSLQEIQQKGYGLTADNKFTYYDYEGGNFHVVDNKREALELALQYKARGNQEAYKALTQSKSYK